MGRIQVGQKYFKKEEKPHYYSITDFGTPIIQSADFMSFYAVYINCMSDVYKVHQQEHMPPQSSAHILGMCM